MSESFVYMVIDSTADPNGNGTGVATPTCVYAVGVARPTWHDHAYFALYTRFVGRPAGRRAASITHAHGAVPDYIIDYRSKRTCSQSRFRDFCQDFKISGKISRFQARFQRFQDFRQDFRDFKISGKIS